MRLFVDTNVLFDIFAQREPFFEASQKMLVMQACGDADLWTSPQSYLDIFCVLSKAIPADKLQDKLQKVLTESTCARQATRISQQPAPPDGTTSKVR